ncbi:TetR/AcrR family transcriptional regulator [Mycobacterium adipatum]|uniref:TetR/AcrR family transcriptional regulator n=1 Tax=Mycobacterium adipatum TaxID=1682113 RepID=UPI0034E09D0D
MDKRYRMVRSALTLAAAQGVSRMSLRDVAAESGVSLGLVQYYFGTKAALVAAVDDHVLGVVSQILQSGVPRDCRGPAQLQNLFAQLMFRDQDALAYLARALGDGDPVGAVLFDRLVEVSPARSRTETDWPVAQNADPLWSAMNLVILGLGTIMFRHHVERVLGHPLDAPAQLARWAGATTSLLQDGYFSRENK